jgi:hypothetical protein
MFEELNYEEKVKLKKDLLQKFEEAKLKLNEMIKIILDKKLHEKIKELEEEKVVQIRTFGRMVKKVKKETKSMLREKDEVSKHDEEDIRIIHKKRKEDIKLIRNPRNKIIDDIKSKIKCVQDEDGKDEAEKMKRNNELEDLENKYLKIGIPVPENKGYNIENGLLGMNRDINIKLTIYLKEPAVRQVNILFFNFFFNFYFIL